MVADTFTVEIFNRIVTWDNSIKTMALLYRSNTLVVNKVWFENLSEAQRYVIMKHEVKHCLHSRGEDYGF